MTVLVKPVSGYLAGSRNIEYISCWDKNYRTDSGMKFFAADISGVVDLEILPAGGLDMYTYPHNNRKYVEEAVDFYENFLVDLLQKEAKNQGRTVFTVDLLPKVPVLVTKEDFSSYYVGVEEKTELFIFHEPEIKNGFPKIFVSTKEQRTSTYKELLPVQAFSSHMIATCVSAPTLTGKHFSFMLLNSFRHGKFMPDVPPNMDNVDLPTRGDADLPSTLPVDKLKEFGEKVGTYGPTVIEGTVTNKPPVTSLVDESVNNELKLVIQKQVLSSQTVNLTDMFTLGMEETVALIPIQSEIITVHMDVANVAEKMCVYEGRIHILPYAEAEDFDPGAFFGANDAIFAVHYNAESFPRRFAVKK